MIIWSTSVAQAYVFSNLAARSNVVGRIRIRNSLRIFCYEMCLANSVVRQRVVWENHVYGILFDTILFSMKYLYSVQLEKFRTKVDRETCGSRSKYIKVVNPVS